MHATVELEAAEKVDSLKAQHPMKPTSKTQNSRTMRKKYVQIAKIVGLIVVSCAIKLVLV